MKLKYLLIDLSKIPDGWEIDKFIKYMNTMKIPFKDLNGFNEIELNVSFWKWCKFTFFNTGINWR